jgi:hypothetical protein
MHHNGFNIIVFFYIFFLDFKNAVLIRTSAFYADCHGNLTMA